jgi:hypothetical protein
VSSKKNVFKGLYLDRDMLSEWINEFGCDNFTSCHISEIYNVSGNQFRCSINGDEKEVLIDFYYNLDGTTTLQPKVGQQVDLSIKLATQITSKLHFKETDIKSSSYSVFPISDENVFFIIEYLEEIKGVNLISKVKNDANKYTLYQFQGNIGDKITLIHYDKGRFQVQGKPYYIYQEVTCLLSAYFPFDEVIKKQSEYYSVEINPIEIRTEMQQIMPSAYIILDEQLRKILSTSLALSKIDIQLEDYSSFVFPALKTLEGYLKNLFLQHDIIIKKDGFGEYLNYWNNAAVLRPEPREKIGNVAVIVAIEKCYAYYNKQRHGLFHSEAIASSTRIIEKKENADSIINFVLELIETTYNEIISSAD